MLQLILGTDIAVWWVTEPDFKVVVGSVWVARKIMGYSLKIVRVKFSTLS
jgi:hypothetical protein